MNIWRSIAGLWGSEDPHVEPVGRTACSIAAVLFLEIPGHSTQPNALKFSTHGRGLALPSA